jgi:thiamine pyrophosphate-dependent acetolactate synthase large subunit-like protein
MKDLYKQFLDHGLSRRSLMRRLGAAGLGTVAARSIVESLVAPAAAAEAPITAPPSGIQNLRGSGGALFVKQLAAAGVKFYFCNPSTGDAPIYDAMVDEPGIQLIKGIQEGVVVGMADGYSRMSGKVGVASIANVGLWNGVTQLVNAYKDRTPLLLVVASFSREASGRDGPQDYDHQDKMLQPLTKFYWQADDAATLPEVTRRSLKFASTPPGGPVFLSISEDQLSEVASSNIIDGALFDVPMKIRPDAADVEKVARLLIEAKNPYLTVGDEVTVVGANAQVVELAEMLGLPVAGGGEFGQWSKPFPTHHPLYIGPILERMRYPTDVDVHLNIGNEYGEVRSPGSILISIRRDPTSLARVSPVDIGLVADPMLATSDLIDAIKSLATKDRLQQIAEERGARVRQYTDGMAQMRADIMKDAMGDDNNPVKLERLAYELENGLDPETIYVNDIDSAKKMDPFLSFGGTGKTYVANGPSILGWGMSAATGVKLARPDMPVISILGDGAFLFGGPQPLWSQARYQVPITNIVVNNRSYNNERNRIWTFIGGRQFATGKDMVCYNGSPNVDIRKTSEAFGVEAELVSNPTEVAAALKRGRQANVEGRPYLLEILVQRDGVGAASEWYPPYSVAAQRTRKV